MKEKPIHLFRKALAVFAVKTKTQSTQSSQRGNRGLARHGTLKILAVFVLLAVKIKPQSSQSTQRRNKGAY
ncbi:hypothetical protein TPE_2759 [Treponema pedis str. T A4]|uniref:Uncharacterized protein n=1 Tax=Treponema pedis str. T A4 TaxID=1291379 RepID=S6A5B7_9SPIR|nr:hypothetical protein TPE_2759 [Treponema pedis str. T A4]